MPLITYKSNVRKKIEIKNNNRSTNLNIRMLIFIWFFVYILFKQINKNQF